MTSFRSRLLFLLSTLVFLNLTIFLTPDKAFNQDLGRHLKLGQIISQTHQVPKTNLLSHTMPDQRFVNHHWLSQVIFWQTYQTSGLTGLMVLRALLINAIFGFLTLTVLFRLKKSPWVMAPFLILGILLVRNRFDLRPELFTYLLTAVFVFLLQKPLTVKRTILLTFLQLLWANLHIFFFLGPFLVATSLLEQTKTTYLNKKRFSLIQFWPLLPVSAVNLVNPNGLVGALFPLLILRGYGYSVVENQSVFFLKRYFPHTNFSLYYAALLVTLLSGIYSVWRRRIDHLLWQILALGLSLKMIRNFPFIPLLGLAPLADNFRHFTTLPALKAHRQNLSLGALFLAIVIGLTGLVLLPTKLTHFRFEMNYDRLGTFLESHQVQGNIFNNYDIGSFLIWKLYPQQRVFVDNRPEAYSKAFFEEIYKPMQLDLATFQTLADQYDIKTIIWSKTDITPWSQTFTTTILPQLDTWEKAYEDQYGFVLTKK